MPDPASNSTPGYLWLYRFCHTVAGNLTTVFGRRIPGASSLIVLALALLLPASACTPRYLIHPGALNSGDSAAYDVLLVAQATIDQARTALQTGQLPGSAKAPLNALIASYNVAHESWLAYRGAIATNVPSDVYFNQLTVNLTDLTNAIRAFKGEGAQ